jgi:hypothetical protein
VFGSNDRKLGLSPRKLRHFSASSKRSPALATFPDRL